MTKQRKHRPARPGYLSGQMLIAMPTMSDKRFRRSVIYMCSHSKEGAMGLVVNRQTAEVSFRDLMEQLGIGEGDEDASPASLGIMIGGPVAKERGFVLHTSDYFCEDASLAIADGICLTATLDILKAIAAGKGPRRAALALGYAGWAAGQLEAEIVANVWLHCPADSALLFGQDHGKKYDHALAKLGIDLANLVTEAGHA